jgi:hypothetical protein
MRRFVSTRSEAVNCQVRRTRPADGRRAEVNVRFHVATSKNCRSGNAHAWTALRWEGLSRVLQGWSVRPCFDLLVRLAWPLAIMPSARTGFEQLHALEALWPNWFPRSSVRQANSLRSWCPSKTRRRGSPDVYGCCEQRWPPNFSLRSNKGGGEIDGTNFFLEHPPIGNSSERGEPRTYRNADLVATWCISQGNR